MWSVREFDKHRHEWERKPTMSLREVKAYLGINDTAVKRLEALGWISRYGCGYGNTAYDRFEIIAFAHEVGLRT